MSCTSGVAQTTVTITSALAIDGFGAPDEGVDERIRDVTEHRTDDALEQRRGELVRERELDLAAVGRERRRSAIRRAGAGTDRRAA